MYLYFTARALGGVYSDQAARETYAALNRIALTEHLFNGPGYGVDTLGGIVVYEAGGYVLPVVALLGVFLVVRHTRAAEDSGLAELTGATAVARRAPLGAALLLAAFSGLLVGLTAAGALLLQSAATGGLLPVAGCCAYGLGVALAVAQFAVVAAVAAQWADHARVANGLGGVAVGLAYLARAVADVRDEPWALATPLGWLQGLRPFAGEQWGWTALALVWLGVWAGAAFWLGARRDLGAGLRRPRTGPATAPAAWGRPLGLTWRLGRLTIACWAAGLFVFGLALGAVADGVMPYAASWDADVEAWLGGDRTAGFFGLCAVVFGVLSACAGLGLVFRARAEETAGRLEHVLAGPLGRRRWGGAQVAVALAGVAASLLAAGLGLACGRRWSMNDGQTWETLGAVAAHLPAAAAVTTLATLLVAAWPRWAPAVWGYVAWSLAVPLVGTLLRLPGWAQDLSVFNHTPVIPLSDGNQPGWALTALAALAALLLATAAVAWRHRDLPGTARSQPRVPGK
ncbi:MAG: hypothetical protein LBR19_09395 [Bifidobacteriaceae bacterium]|nr:hypothetical protein [Bifidobacteriaceae bacterium]